MIKRLAVYCGSSNGADPAFAGAARLLGAELAARGIGLVYGGGKLGLMGEVAEAALARGGEVHGVIPEALKALELAHGGLTALHVVGSLHERKARMTELADGFIALPGGIGTLDELFEAWSWNALGYHAKPFAVLNVGGYWDNMLAFLDTAMVSGFISAPRRAQLIVAESCGEAIDKLDVAAAKAVQGMTL